ncbi:hypothetical protein Tco_0845362 [Tanacetum coccineum]
MINICGDLDEHQTSITLELNEEESYDKSLSEANVIDTSQSEATIGNKGKTKETKFMSKPNPSKKTRKSKPKKTISDLHTEVADDDELILESSPDWSLCQRME